MKWDGPDGINSWLICFACCFINAMMRGTLRLSGMLLVASIERFKVGRKQASFPYTFCSAIWNLSGPIVGYLGCKFGLRAVSAFGALIGAVAVGGCFFAESITLVAVLYGVLFGFGNSLGSSLLPMIINEYFGKHRATASGISFSGACLGSFILPPIVEILLNNYGLSQTFLFLAGFILICIPVALLLRKPMFEIQSTNPCNKKQTETLSYISGTIQPLYSKNNEYNNSQMVQTSNSDISSFPKVSEYISENNKILSYEDLPKTLTTETVLYGYSEPISYLERTCNEEIMKDRKETRKGILKIQQDETFNLSSGNSGCGRMTKEVDMLDKNIYFSKMDSQQNVSHNKYAHCLSDNRILFSKQNNTFDEIPIKSHQIYSYESELNKDQDSCTSDIIDSTKRPILQNFDKQFSNFSSLIQEYPDKIIHSPENVKDTYHCSLEYSKSLEYPDVQSKIEVDKECVDSKTKTISPLRSLIVICDPMFVLIAVTNAIRMFSFVCIVAIMVDFSRDLHIKESNEKYMVMLFSVGDIAGRLGLGWITDCGYMSTPTFTAVCFFGQGLFSAAIVWSNDFISLATLVTIYGFAQAGLIVIFPILIAQFIEHDKQTVAIPSSNFLSGPLCLAITPLIGYFRDEIGAYNWIFYGITMISATSSVSWIFVSCIKGHRRKNESFSSMKKKQLVSDDVKIKI